MAFLELWSLKKIKHSVYYHIQHEKQHIPNNVWHFCLKVTMPHVYLTSGSWSLNPTSKFHKLVAWSLYIEVFELFTHCVNRNRSEADVVAFCSLVVIRRKRMDTGLETFCIMYSLRKSFLWRDLERDQSIFMFCRKYGNWMCTDCTSFSYLLIHTPSFFSICVILTIWQKYFCLKNT